MSIVEPEPLAPRLLPSAPAHFTSIADEATANRPFGLTNLVPTTIQQVATADTHYDPQQQLTVGTDGQPYVARDMAGTTLVTTLDTKSDMQHWTDTESDAD
ncbi:putative ATP-grasp-modified RiPP [Goodfellowiella coeruleoviolacea]|uniref:ATP-grasp target RiPP n=1 Tax=Goodfellowiella coeruleoviolacea TaxID=334858 RepID=A0AAE3GH81_9PSEU|nr:putative ATP-grasp-modified RiPP [Goodfellowiella coeruleoviolacea]MCP2167310.1 putative ATP-grasp target RiPP [Goodfellowiella coeruleoviolacea]